MNGERSHRRFSPSQSERNFGCLGATNLLARVPALPESEYAKEGTRAHEILEIALRNGIPAKEAHEEYSSLFAETLDDGKNEFYFAINMALRHICAIVDDYHDAQMWLERFVVPPTENEPGEAAGYCDIAIYIPSIRVLYVIDYKHGAGIAKDPDIPQLKQYGAGFLYEENALIDPASVDEVILSIIQPRAFHKDGPIREFKTTPYALWEYLEELDAMIGQAIKPDAPLTPGPWCSDTFCDARAVCPAREAQALSVASSAFKQITDLQGNVPPPPAGLDINRLALIRAHAPTLRKWLDEIDARAYELARSGHHIPGAKLVEAQPRRKYYGHERDVARKLAAMIGERDAEVAMDEFNKLLKTYPVLDAIFNINLIAITTAEKLIVEAYKQRVGRTRKTKAAEEARHAFAYLTLKETSGNLSLVDEADPRPAINRTQSTFQQIAGVFALPPPPQET